MWFDRSSSGNYDFGLISLTELSGFQPRIRVRNDGWLNGKGIIAHWHSAQTGTKNTQLRARRRSGMRLWGLWDRLAQQVSPRSADAGSFRWP